MATATRTVNKANFETGDQPTEANFSTLIDSFLALSATGTEEPAGSISGSSSATGSFNVLHTGVDGGVVLTSANNTKYKLVVNNVGSSSLSAY